MPDPEAATVPAPAPAPNPADLLQRHIPVLRYDSQEPYFADAASEWTDNPGNQLCRANGTVLAAATPPAGQPLLSLSFLDPKQYPSGAAVAKDDRIADPARNYVAQAQALHAQPRYANRVYGHWAKGTDGRTWLAYWFFYFYNDYNLIGPLIKAGLHEGDWEMIQLRLDPTGQEPDLAVYAQHKNAEQRAWDQVERVGDQPVVYPARGSHACYFESGPHWTGAWFDCADGQRPGPPLSLYVLSDTAPADAWALWPGMWGGTEPPPGDVNPLDDSSPRGPGGHAQYRQPDVLLQTATVHEAARTPPLKAVAPLPAPTVSATAVGADLHITYDAHIANPAGLVVSIGALDHPTPPAIQRLPVPQAAGTVVAPGAAAGGQAAVHVSVGARDGRASPAVAVTPR
jgi:hypothetical protein